MRIGYHTHKMNINPFTDAAIIGFLVSGRTYATIRADQIKACANGSTGRRGRVGAFIDIVASFPIIRQSETFRTTTLVTTRYVDAAMSTSAIIRSTFVDI